MASGHRELPTPGGEDGGDLLLINPVGQILELKLPCPGDISRAHAREREFAGAHSLLPLNLILELKVLDSLELQGLQKQLRDLVRPHGKRGLKQAIQAIASPTRTCLQGHVSLSLQGCSSGLAFGSRGCLDVMLVRGASGEI